MQNFGAALCSWSNFWVAPRPWKIWGIRGTEVWGLGGLSQPTLAASEILHGLFVSSRSARDYGQGGECWEAAGEEGARQSGFWAPGQGWDTFWAPFGPHLFLGGWGTLQLGQITQHWVLGVVSSRSGRESLEEPESPFCSSSSWAYGAFRTKWNTGGVCVEPDLPFSGEVSPAKAWQWAMAKFWQLADRTLPVRGLLASVKGDWKEMANVFGLPRWSVHPGVRICWRCKALLTFSNWLVACSWQGCCCFFWGVPILMLDAPCCGKGCRLFMVSTKWLTVWTSWSPACSERRHQHQSSQPMLQRWELWCHSPKTLWMDGIFSTAPQKWSKWQCPSCMHATIFWVTSINQNWRVEVCSRQALPSMSWLLLFTDTILKDGDFDPRCICFWSSVGKAPGQAWAGTTEKNLLGGTLLGSPAKRVGKPQHWLCPGVPSLDSASGRVFPGLCEPQ